MDLILCRNVLMYFATGPAQKVLQNLGRSLVEGGWLIVSLTETSHVPGSPLVTVNFPGASVYRKDSRAAALPEFGKTCTTFQPVVNLAKPTIQRAVSPQPTWVPPPEPPPASVQESVAVAVDGGGRFRANRTGSRRWLGAPNCADRGDLFQALRWCEQAVATDRLNPAWLSVRGDFQEHGRGNQAVLSLRKATYLDQDFVMAHFAQGNLTLRQGDARGARKHFDNVLALLDGYQQDDLLPESEGITAGRLKEIVLSTISMRRLGERKMPLSKAAGTAPQEQQQIFKARARALAQELGKPAEPENHLEVLVFSLAFERYGLETSFVREVYPLKELTPMATNGVAQGIDAVMLPKVAPPKNLY